MSGRKRKREHDKGWMALLREYELDGLADRLAAKGVWSSKDVFHMLESDVSQVMRDAEVPFRFRGLWGKVQQEFDKTEGVTPFEKAARELAEREEAEREQAEREQAEHKKVKKEADAFERTIDGLQQKADIVALVRGMQTYTTHFRTQKKGCRALRNLAVNADNKIKIAEQGGIDVILEAMRTCKSHAGVQRVGCGALCRLAVNADNKIKIAEQGGIDVIREAMRTYKSHSGVQEWGRWALRHWPFKK